MANFTESLMEPQGAGARPLSPIRQQESPYIQLGASLASIFARNLDESEKQKKEEAKQAILGEFVRSQTTLSQAGEQGVDRARVAAMARANYSKFVSNYPNLVKEFSDANKNLFENTELGEAKELEQSRQDELRQIRRDAVNQGVFIPEGASPQTEAAILSNFQSNRAMMAEFEKRVKMNTEQRAQEGADRARLDAERKDASVTLLSQLGSEQINIAQNVIRDASFKAKQGDVKGAEMDLAVYFSNIEGVINSASAHNPALAGIWKDMFGNLKKSGIELLNDKTTNEVLENQLKEIQTKAQLAALKDPRMQALYATSKVLGGNIPATFWDANSATKDFLVSYASGAPSGVSLDLSDKKALQTSQDFLKHNLSMVEQGKVSDVEGTLQQIGNVATGVLTQIKTQAIGGQVSNEAFKAAADLIASPTFAKIVDKGLVAKAAMAGAIDTLNVTYNQGVGKAIENQLGKPFGKSATGDVPLSNLVDLKWSGSGVKIQVGNKGTSGLTSGTASLDSAILSLQGSEKALNQLIKMGAHLEGHTDYAKYWEENKFRILPTYYPDPEVIKEGQVYEMDGKKFKYTGGVPWRNKEFWIEEKASE